MDLDMDCVKGEPKIFGHTSEGPAIKRRGPANPILRRRVNGTLDEEDADEVVPH